MADRPIIMTGESVRAILAGRKTMTRRVIKLRQFGRSDTPGYDWTFRDKRGLWNDFTNATLLTFPRRLWVPYRTGDTLWVREAWCLADPEYANEGGPKYYFAATDEGVEASGHRKNGQPRSPWKSPLSMPRWASRLSLRVTDVRVERLQAITEDDARAEGVEPASTGRRGYPGTGAAFVETHRAGFEQAWDAINAKRAPWASNPWVWVVAFEVVK